MLETLEDDYYESEKNIKLYFGELDKSIMRDMIVKDKKRLDNRGYSDIRDISCEISVLPRTHGSALFTRGETQSLAVATLGTKIDEHKIEGVDGAFWKRYMIHYNFPSYSVG